MRLSMLGLAVVALLSFNADIMLGLKFINVMIHDGWRSKAKDSIIGVSIAFIDHLWDFRHIAILVTVVPDGHGASLVAEAIKTRLREVYGMDIISLAKWMMSDTASAAHAVSNYFPDLDQEDCAMHLINLCINYGLGLRDNIVTKSVYDTKTQSRQRVKVITTPGGTFEEGGQLIKKLRNLSAHFGAGSRGQQLTRVQNALSFPKLAPLIAPETRVAVCCKLIRRSILNYNAMASFFRGEDDSNRFSSISIDEWKLAIEMEAVTNFISELALVEFQRSSILPSYLLIFRNMALANLQSTEFQSLTLKPPERDVSDDTQVREPKSFMQFSPQGKVCITRCIAQVKARFPVISKEMILTLMLDPRTKDIAGSIAENMGGDTTHSSSYLANLVVEARSKFSRVHYKIYKKQQQPEAETESSPDHSPAIDIQKPQSHLAYLFGAPVPSPSKRRLRENHLRVKAESIVCEWMKLEVDWVQISLVHHPPPASDANKTKDTKQIYLERKKKLTLSSGSGSVWNLLELYRLVDSLRWFREVGEKQFPSVAVLARQLLGKVSASAYQERVFSTGEIVLGPLRTRTENSRGEKQLLLRQNREMLRGTDAEEERRVSEGGQRIARDVR